MTPNVPILAVAGGAVALTMYNRHIWQDVWSALRGQPLPLANLSAPQTVSSGNPAPPQNGVALPTSGGANDPLSQAEAAETATRTSSDWVNWCLQWTDDVFQRLGEATSTGTNGRAATAIAACDEHTLTTGIAPRGAAVCFSQAYGSAGHIGISDGGATYTSAGLAGGVQSRNYLSDPNYIGWYAP